MREWRLERTKQHRLESGLQIKSTRVLPKGQMRARVFLQKRQRVRTGGIAHCVVAASRDVMRPFDKNCESLHLLSAVTDEPRG